MLQNFQNFTFGKLFCGISLALIFVSEIFFSIYGSLQGTATAVFDAENQAVESRMAQNDFKERQEELKKELGKLDASSATKIEKNQKANQEGRLDAELYDEKIRQDSKRASELKSEYQVWEDTKLKPIRDFYADKKRRGTEGSWLGWSTAVLPGLVISLLVAVFGYHAARNEGNDRKTLLACSYVCQIIASVLMWEGIMDRFNDEVRAYLLSGGLLCVSPLAYKFGILEIMKKKEQVKPDKENIRELPVVADSKLKQEVNEHTEEESLIHRKTIRSSKSELQVPVSLTSAIMLYRSGRISKDNGWSQRKIARLFAGGDLNKVHRLIADGSTLPVGMDVSETVKQSVSG